MTFYELCASRAEIDAMVRNIGERISARDIEGAVGQIRQCELVIGFLLAQYPLNKRLAEVVSEEELLQISRTVAKMKREIMV